MDNIINLKIRPMYFVPNIADRFKDNRRVHYIGYMKCNYQCEFCSYHDFNGKSTQDVTLEEFEKIVWKLLTGSKNFKFSGGEPTLNPFLPDLMRITKIYGSQNFLDTNGSRPEKVKALVDEGLVDILGISLKGLTPEDAALTANIKNIKLCWDNVFESISYGCKAGIQVIVTYVACDGFFKEEDFDTLAKLLEPYPDITLKINNCSQEEVINYRRRGLDKTEIYAMVERFVERYPEYKGRTVLFRDNSSCSDATKIALF